MLAITATDKEKFEFRLVASHDTYQMRAQSYKQLLEWTSYMDKVAPCWRKPKVAATAVTFAAKMKRQAAARRSSEEAAYALTTPSTARALADTPSGSRDVDRPLSPGLSRSTSRKPKERVLFPKEPLESTANRASTLVAAALATAALGVTALDLQDDEPSMKPGELAAAVLMKVLEDSAPDAPIQILGGSSKDASPAPQRSQSQFPPPPPFGGRNSSSSSSPAPKRKPLSC